ncbi:PREDICTED: TNF receptor-associated factor 2-like [Branchiostoma belcheri]|uniref:TNF receptor-associated factor 2-like n=1 Tax=Branchiostoma belcheri TaxID=7741 RepID=A0A6P4YP43_BRABE|nr:PREDICTED: TNF receptor-associated factor 2-like [Branchiostoma belcheri]
MPGYPLEIFDIKVQDKYLCSACRLALREPLQTYCGHRYCKSCLDEIFRYAFPDRAIKRDIGELPAKCRNAEACEWKGNIQKYDAHQETCEFGLIPCPKQGCGKQVMRMDLAAHLEKECAVRQIKCKYCAQEILLKEERDHRACTCPQFPMNCEFCGKKKIPRAQMKQHLDENTGDCKRLKVACTFAKVGCPTKLEREKLNDHIAKHHVNHLNQVLDKHLTLMQEFTILKQSGQGQHMQQAMASKQEEMRHKYVAMETRVATFEGIVAVLNREIEKCSATIEAYERQRRQDREIIESIERKMKSQERIIALKDVALAELDLRIRSLEMTSYDGTLLWKIQDFTRKRHDAITGKTTSIYSPCLYTSRTGYKMCARIYLNGDGMGKGSHIGLYFVLMRGHFDGLLRWPFRQKVTFMLLDQNNREHVIDAFRPDPTSSSFKRPTSDLNIASGCPLFMPHSQLESTRHAYVRDDAIFLKIIVDTSDLN